MIRNINIRHIKQLDEFEKLHKNWDGLLSSRETKTIFLTWEWLFAWWKTHLHGKDLWLITAWQREELVGIAPLMLVREKKYKLRFRLLQSLGTPNTDECDFICKNDDLEILREICSYIIQNKKQWDAILLHEHLRIRPSTSIIKDTFGSEGFRVNIKTNIHYHIPITRTWDVYFKSLSKNMRQNLDRRLRRTQEEHQINFEFYRGPDVKWDHFKMIFEVNKKGAFPEKYESETEKSFHRELLESTYPQSPIEIAFLKLDGKPVAFEYGFNVNGRFEDWRTGYDQNYSKESVGKTLLYLLLKELFSQGYNDFDFLRGEYSHKQDWHPAEREFSTIRVIQPFHIKANIVLFVIPGLWQWIKIYILKKKSVK